MENIDLIVLRSLFAWRRAGKHALLATVLRTWGSSPRPIGSIMTLAEDGAVVGSVSGGCIEDDLIYKYTRAYAQQRAADFPSGPPVRVKYGISADEAHRFGLPCGGTLEMLLEFDPDPDSLASLLGKLDDGELVRRRVKLLDGATMLEQADAPEELIVNSQEVVSTFGPGLRMLLIGAGQLAEYVATMALFNGFTVSVCDPREEYIRSWNVGAATLVSGMPDDVVRNFQLDQSSCVIALTHDPKLDDMALLEALESDAFYIGAIGSRRNNTARQARMKEHFGMTDADLERLRGPIGIYIGSKTPSEIAVSIMAEVLAVKNGVVLAKELNVAQAKNTSAKAPNDGQVCM